jgi:CheY-like chemotaxis protein
LAIRKVLIVDDDEDIRRVAEIALRRIGGWDAVHAASGSEAIAQARAEQPDVILLDVMMPDGDGPQTLARLRADPATAKLPVIFLTARVQKRELDSYRGLGATGVIEKPFDATALPDEIRRIVEGARPRGGGEPDDLGPLREGYRRRLPEKLAQLDERLQSARSEPRERPRIEAARELAHTLKGTSGSHGLAGVCAELGRIESALDEVLAGRAEASGALWSELAAALVRARARIGEAP